MAAEANLTKERVIELLALSSGQVESLEELISAEEESAISSAASVPASPDVSEELEKAITDLLTSREREVIELRFGLLDGYYRTQAETGEALGLSGVGVGQIEKRALAKLRTSPELRELL